MHSLPALFVFGLLIMASPPVLSCYSGLLIVPTTDTVEMGQFSAELQIDGSVPERNVSNGLINTEFGISDRLEAGVDFDWSETADERVLPNFKYIVFNDKNRRFAGAVGVCSAQPRIANNPYAVIGRAWSSCRLFSGIQRANGSTRWFVGADHRVSDRFTLMADFTNGGDNFSSFGFNYQINNRFGIMAGAEFPNVSGDTLFTIHFVLGGPYRNGSRGE
ncbi:MAG: hypothetical protein M1133_15270 [Armatimonadetes bacterium]|nr:hypothetical protein [Armatimonadota bacterium]